MNHSVIICLVDDDEVYQFCMKKIIENLNTKQIRKILGFSDGEEALGFMSQNAGNNSELPNVILLDINMPIMDGWQFMEEYVKLKPKIEKRIIIYMVSSSKNDEDIERAKTISEISDYLVKPVTPEELQLILDTLPIEQGV
jgi:CheY-like chemotaxis protein